MKITLLILIFSVVLRYLGSWFTEAIKLPSGHILNEDAWFWIGTIAQIVAFLAAIVAAVLWVLSL